MQTNNRLPAAGRLKHRKLIDALFSGGQKFSASPYRVYFTVQPATAAHGSGVLFGTGVSKKKFRRAVDRNLVKRRCREAYRLQQDALQQLARDNNWQLMLFLIYTGNNHLPFDSCYAAVTQALDKVGRRLSRPPGKPGSTTDTAST
ncbi:MAG: ribonuclease P protein component [Flavihumibacter sp.]